MHRILEPWAVCAKHELLLFSNNTPLQVSALVEDARVAEAARAEALISEATLSGRIVVKVTAAAGLRTKGTVMDAAVEKAVVAEPGKKRRASSPAPPATCYKGQKRRCTDAGLQRISML